MNTTVQLLADGEPDQLIPGFQAVERFVERSEQRFSRFRSSSELSDLNRASGRWFEASAELFEVMEQALKLHSLTGGLFDPSVLDSLKQLGYDRSMDQIRGADLPAAPDPAWTSPPFNETRLDPERRAIRLPAGTQIDLGGIAKGWIAAQAAELLHEYSVACAVSAGGDMALVGLPAGRTAWEVSLEDPRDPDRVLAVVRTPPGGLATSTVTRRHWTQGGKPRHHIIDPRSGRPSNSSWLSVTAQHQSPLLVEAFAKALLIVGPTGAPALAGGVEDLGYLAVDPDGRLVGSPAEMEIIRVPEPAV